MSLLSLPVVFSLLSCQPKTDTGSSDDPTNPPLSETVASRVEATEVTTKETEKIPYVYDIRVLNKRNDTFALVNDGKVSDYMILAIGMSGSGTVNFKVETNKETNVNTYLVNKPKAGKYELTWTYGHLKDEKDPNKGIVPVQYEGKDVAETVSITVEA